MHDLIRALTILSKYVPEGTYSPTHCEHDVLLVPAADDETIPEAAELDALGFHFSTEYNCWASFRFGSC